IPAGGVRSLTLCSNTEAFLLDAIFVLVVAPPPAPPPPPPVADAQNNKMAVPSRRARTSTRTGAREPRGRKGIRRKTPKAVATGIRDRERKPGAKDIAMVATEKSGGRGRREGAQLGAPNAKAIALSSKWEVEPGHRDWDRE
ncbi:hypothetical protein KR009_003611, partial [Drosophila setifemur]